MKYFVIALLLLFCSVTSKAQITITESDFAAIATQAFTGTTYNTSGGGEAALTALIPKNGANQTWDFTGGTYTATTGTNSEMLTYPGGAYLADDPLFTSATNVLKLTSPGLGSFYLFLRITPDGVWDLGSTIDAGQFNQKTGHTPGNQILKFPLTYGDSWTSTYTETSGSGLTQTSETHVVTNTVDGWGTLVLPGGISQPALRVMRRDTITQTNTGNQQLLSYTYDFFTKAGYRASVSSDDNVVATSGDYSIPQAGSSVADNANASDRLGLRVIYSTSNGPTVAYSLANAGAVRVEMMDALGRTVGELQNGFGKAGVNELAIDAKGLAAGSYFVRVQTGTGAGMERVIVAH
jgi:hypothetical protein